MAGKHPEKKSDHQRAAEIIGEENLKKLYDAGFFVFTEDGLDAKIRSFLVRQLAESPPEEPLPPHTMRVKGGQA